MEPNVQRLSPRDIAEKFEYQLNMLIAEAWEHGVLVGGNINFCVQINGASDKWNPVHRLSVIRETPATTPVIAAPAPATKPAGAKPMFGKDNGYTGDICVCGSGRVKRTGTCAVCEDCGQSVGGCS